MNINSFYSFKHKIFDTHNLFEIESKKPAESNIQSDENEIEIINLDDEDELELNEKTEIDNDDINFINAAKKMKHTASYIQPTKKSEIFISNSLLKSIFPKKKSKSISLLKNRVTLQVNECLICPAVLPDILQLDEHIALHSLLKCKMCEQNFLRYSNLKRHFNEKHAKPKTFFCNVCGVSFSFLINLQKHLNVAHSKIT